MVGLEVEFHDFRQGVKLCADCDDEADVGLLGESIELFKELFRRRGVFAARDFEEAVDENGADIVVLGEKTTDEAVKAFKPGDCIIDGVDQAAVMIDVIGQLLRFFNSDHAAMHNLNCLVDHLNQLFGFAGAFEADDAFDHRNLSFNNYAGLRRGRLRFCSVRFYYSTLHRLNQ